MRLKSFRYCMLIGALALGGVAVFYFVNYMLLGIALRNSGIQPFLQASIQAMWLSFAVQGLLIALAYALVAFRPHAVTREVIVLFGLLQLVEAVLLFVKTGSSTVAAVLAVAAVFVLIGSALWPKKLPPPIAVTPGATVIAGVPVAQPVTTATTSAPPTGR
jgi:hypothetical protein